MKTNDDLRRSADEEWGSAVAWSEFDYDDLPEERNTLLNGRN